MHITYHSHVYVVTSELELKHLLARLQPPPYAVRKCLREATLKVGRKNKTA